MKANEIEAVIKNAKRNATDLMEQLALEEIKNLAIKQASLPTPTEQTVAEEGMREAFEASEFSKNWPHESHLACWEAAWQAALAAKPEQKGEAGGSTKQFRKMDEALREIYWADLSLQDIKRLAYDAIPVSGQAATKQEGAPGDVAGLIEALKSWIDGYGSFTDEAIQEYLSLSESTKARVLASRQALSTYTQKAPEVVWEGIGLVRNQDIYKTIRLDGVYCANTPSPQSNNTEEAE